MNLLLPSTYHAIPTVKVFVPCPAAGRLHPGGRLRTLTSALQRAGASLGQPASAELENATVYYVPSEPTSVMKVSPIFPTIGIHNRVQ